MKQNEINTTKIEWLQALLKKKKAYKLHYYKHIVITRDKELYELKTGNQIHIKRSKARLKKKKGEIHTVNINNCFNFYFGRFSDVKKRKMILRDKLYILQDSKNIRYEIDLKTYSKKRLSELATYIQLEDDEEMRPVEEKHIKTLLEWKQEDKDLKKILEEAHYKNLYVTNKGRLLKGTVFNRKKTGEALRSATAPYHFYSLKLYEDTRVILYVHRLIAMVFKHDEYIEMTNQFELNNIVVNHKDGDKTNNNIENLEWCSQAYNVQHARLMQAKKRAKLFKEYKKIS
ncbi:HNH endonuclease signature motif containing protein [Staphylococcus felis]|uniref:HNH nuclease domain-containing protein n=1 Tax=Staphylococcus felis TaxID=46127 RepID=A0A3E0INZ7_9STAP|nr:HNH endonuclease signature motif containing protein [Staphylococcus felis]REH94319.1 hypothetical protein DOS83_07670 [Staphylococcus felis]